MGLRPRWRKSSGSAAPGDAWLWPGWAIRTSWLRTHPATQERISRLLTLAPRPASTLPFHAPFLPESRFDVAPTRWRLSGHNGADCESTETFRGLPRPARAPRRDHFIGVGSSSPPVLPRSCCWRFLPAIEGLVQSARGGENALMTARGDWRRTKATIELLEKSRLGGLHHHRTIGTRCLDAWQRLPCRAGNRLGLHLGVMRARRHQLPRHRGASEATVKLADGPRITSRALGGRAQRTTSPAQDRRRFQAPPAVPVGTSADLRVGRRCSLSATLRPGLDAHHRCRLRARPLVTRRSGRPGHRSPDPDRRRH